MRKIDGPGAVGNAFVDYDAVTNPNGTVYTADYGNDVQDELVAIQDEFSIAEAAGTNAYIKAAIIGMTKKYSKELGELYYLDSVKDPAEFDKDDPDSFFPGKCLDTIDTSETLSATNWPLLVPHLRTKALTYFDGITGEKSSFSVTGWAIVSNVATLTFANTTAEKAILAALTEDELVHGSVTNWRSITLSAAIGDITAGEYAITDVDAASRTIDFAFVAGNNSGSGSYTVNFYENRIPGSTTTARLYEAKGRAMISANDAAGEGIAGLRRRDRIQAHAHYRNISLNNELFLDKDGSPRDRADPAAGAASKGVVDEVTGALSGTVRGGATTDPRSIIGHIYIHGGSYSA